ncbi:hypothetical protein TWF281_004992 [Arthrobotrys megalospora]
MPPIYPNNAQKLDPASWEPHKHRIIELWLPQENNLAFVMETIRAETGFIASEAQYRRQLSEVWRIKKNFSGPELEFINNTVQERTAQGKETRVKRHGVQIPLDNLKRRTTRRFVSTLDAIAKMREQKSDNPVSGGNKDFETEGLDIGTPTTVANTPGPPISSPETLGGETPRVRTREPSPIVYTKNGDMVASTPRSSLREEPAISAIYPNQYRPVYSALFQDVRFQISRGI